MSDNRGLVKTFGLFSALLLVVGSMIGSGVFKKVAPMMNELGDPIWVLVAWLLAGLISLLGALTNAEVAGLIAEPGGQYAYFKHMYGKPFAFIYGWSMMTVVQTATGASVAYVFAESLNTIYALPRLPHSLEEIEFLVFKPFENSGVKMATIAVLLGLTFINYMGVKFGGLVLKILSISVISCIAFIIILNFFFSDGNFANLTTEIENYNYPSSSGFVGAMFAAMMSAFWAYEGWNTVGFLGGEIKNPHKNIPRALTFGTMFVIVLYLIVNAAYMYVLTPQELVDLHNAGGKIAAVEAIRTFLGAGGVMFILILILMSTFNSTNTTIMGAPRIYFAMAKDGLFFKSVGETHPKYHTPAKALLIQGIWSSVLVLSGSFDQLTDMLIFAAFIFYGLGAYGVFVLRRKLRDTPRLYKVFGYPWVPAIFVAFCSVLVVISVLERPREALIGTVLILTGFPVYFWLKKRNNGFRQNFN